jgi:hypothetical protein
MRYVHRDFLYRAKLHSQKLLSQGYVQPLLKSSLQKYYDRHHDLVDRYDVPISQMRLDILDYISRHTGFDTHGF